MNLVDFAILSFGSLFVIVDPITLIPTFLVITKGSSKKEQVRMSAMASLITFLILGVFAIGGQFIFKAFGITLPALQIAGGIILMMIALDMLKARPTPVKETPEELEAGANKDDIAITPLAIPMLAGPGAITAVTLLASKASSPEHWFVLLINIFIICIITFVVLWFAATRSSILQGIGLKVFTRLMGLLLAVVAIQFVLNGLEMLQF